MRLLILAPRGFCAGVEMAVRALERTLELFGPPVYVYHQIVHNTHVVSDFAARGVTFVDSIDDVPDGAVLLYSAHGVSPEVRLASERKALTVIDATCPLVLKVHREARSFAEAGATVVVIGHAGHDEVVGVIGEAPGQSVLVDSPASVDALPAAPGARMAYVTQTTLSLTEASATIERLRQRFPGIAEPPRQDICYATQNRQDAVRGVAGEVELLIVIGSENSSNTARLVEAVEEGGARAYRIDSAAELDFQWFEGVAACAITAGASVPESLVRATIDAIVAGLGVEQIDSRVFATELQSFSLPVALSP
jgi:4-hydroxy-3-methylbut-2-enyl diphosphate reductase